MRQLWSELLSWLAGYETWVLENRGLAWRQTALKPFQHAITPLANLDQLAKQWQSFADQSQTLLIDSYTP